jgi:hypothetical protein
MRPATSNSRACRPAGGDGGLLGGDGGLLGLASLVQRVGMGKVQPAGQLADPGEGRSDAVVVTDRPRHQGCTSWSADRAGQQPLPSVR